MFEIADDSGFLAVIVPATYESFVNTNWQFNQLMQHFQQQMERRHLLIWGTGLEGIWRVNFSIGQSDRRGFREVTGPLDVRGGCVFATNYESLTMAAQYQDVQLPEKHQSNQLLQLEDGEYGCRVIQMFDPADEDKAERADADFFIEFTRPIVRPQPWSKVPWFEG